MPTHWQGPWSFGGRKRGSQFWVRLRRKNVCPRERGGKSEGMWRVPSYQRNTVIPNTFKNLHTVGAPKVRGSPNMICLRFLWPRYAQCLWNRREHIICGVWSGQSLWGAVRNRVTCNAMGWTGVRILKCQWCRYKQHLVYTEVESLRVFVEWGGP